VSFLILDGLQKTYPDGTPAVRGIDLSIERGELIVLLGPSGCGKTTTLRMIAGLELATGGAIRMGGQDVTRLRPSRRDVGMVFQFYALYPHLTVRENIAFPLRAAGVPADQDCRYAALRQGSQRRIQSFEFCNPTNECTARNLLGHARSVPHCGHLGFVRDFGPTASDERGALTDLCGLNAARDIEFAQQVRHVHARRFLADEEFFGDLAVGSTLR